MALGLTAERRSALLPDIPALGETVKGVEAAVIAGVLAPGGTPRSVIDRLNAEFAKAVDSPKAKEIFATNAAEAMKIARRMRCSARWSRTSRRGRRWSRRRV